MRILKILIALAFTAILALIGPPAVFLGWVWWQDGDAPLPIATAGSNDASRLNANQPAEVIAIASDPAEAELQLSTLIQRAIEQHRHISISGAGHSMGGHTLYPGGIVLNMNPFNRMSLDQKQRIRLSHLSHGAG